MDSGQVQRLRSIIKDGRKWSIKYSNGESRIGLHLAKR